MHGIQKLSQGLIISLIVACTVLVSIALSAQGGAARPNVQTIPTITLEVIAAAPSATIVVITPQQTASPITASISPSPTPTSAPTMCPVPGGWQRYVAGPFDTLASIAQKFNTTIDQIVSGNCLATASVTVAQAIYVPSTAPTPTPLTCNPPFNWLVYVVRPGDTLSSTAQRYGISLYTLMRANCLSSSFIYAGQIIRVPPTVPIVTFPPPPIWPTLTPTSVPTIVATPTFVLPTDTAAPSHTPTVMPPTIPPATSTPGITVTPAPSNTPAATDTPAPTSTSAPPTDTPMPTGTSIPPTNPPPTSPPPTNPPPTSPPPTSPPPTNPPPADTAVPPADPTPSALPSS